MGSGVSRRFAQRPRVQLRGRTVRPRPGCRGKGQPPPNGPAFMAPSCQDRPGLAWRLGEAIVIFVKPFRIFWQLPCFQRICCRAKMSVTSRPFWQKVSAHTICCVRRKIAPRLLGIRCAYRVVSTPGMDEYDLQMRFQGVRLEVGGHPHMWCWRTTLWCAIDLSWPLMSWAVLRPWGLYSSVPADVAPWIYECAGQSSGGPRLV